MSWRSHGTSTNDSLIDALEKNNLIASPRDVVGKAMRKVDRKCYVESADANEAYRDHPLQIGSNATISAPHMHAMCLELSKEYVVVNDDDDASGGYGNGRVLGGSIVYSTCIYPSAWSKVPGPPPLERWIEGSVLYTVKCCIVYTL